MKPQQSKTTSFCISKEDLVISIVTCTAFNEANVKSTFFIKHKETSVAIKTTNTKETDGLVEVLERAVVELKRSAKEHSNSI